MTWAVWLAVPVVVTILAACYAWLRARPARTPTADEAMQAHRDYLAALATSRPSRRPPAVHENESPDDAG